MPELIDTKENRVARSYVLLKNAEDFAALVEQHGYSRDKEPQAYPCFCRTEPSGVRGLRDWYVFLYKDDVNALMLAFSEACRPEGETLDKSAWLAMHPVKKVPVAVVTRDWFMEVQKPGAAPAEIFVGS